jgi:hypothetical protein
MGVVLPANSKQNMGTGLVPLTSVRFAISKSLPDRNNASLWTNPCYSGTDSGMYDTAQGYYPLYESASQQTCAARYMMCMNPRTSVMPSNLVNFFFPIGDRTLTDDILLSTVPYSIYVAFQVGIVCDVA